MTFPFSAFIITCREAEMNKTPLFSILLPTYNRAAILPEAIKSVFAQTISDWELIIIDDGSADNTQEVVKPWLADKRVSLVYRENGGCQAARNTGAMHAVGDWLAFADSDDLWTPDKLEKQLVFLGAHPGTVLLSCAYDLSFPDGRLLRIPPETQEERPFLPALLKQNFIGSPTILIRRESYLTLGGLRTDYPALDDWELSLRCLRNGLSMGFVDEVLVHARVSESGMSGNAAAYYDARCRLLADYRDFYLEFGIFEETCAELLARAEHEGILEPVALRLAEAQHTQ